MSRDEDFPSEIPRYLKQTVTFFFSEQRSYSTNILSIRIYSFISEMQISMSSS
jgi:hypothetical protein